MKLLTSLSPRALKLLIIGLPTLLVGIYLWLFAADRYVSEATLAVRRLGAEPASAVPGIATLLTGTNPQSREDIFYVQYYIHSLALLRKLDAEMNVREHYASPRLDPFYRLWPWTGQERFLGVFRDRVQVIFDDAASLLTIRVQGFDPAFAQRLNRRIVEESERFVNELSQRMAREQLAFAEDELKKAAERVQDAKNQVLAFQNRNRLLDPTFQAQASGALLAELQATRARLESDLNSLLTYRNEDSPQVRELRSRIAAVRKQADAEAANATASGRKGEQLTALAVDFQALQMQAEFAVDAYKLSLAAVESARIDATRKIKTAVIIEPPSLPRWSRCSSPACWSTRSSAWCWRRSANTRTESRVAPDVPIAGSQGRCPAGVGLLAMSTADAGTTAIAAEPAAMASHTPGPVPARALVVAGTPLASWLDAAEPWRRTAARTMRHPDAVERWFGNPFRGSRPTVLRRSSTPVPAGRWTISIPRIRACVACSSWTTRPGRWRPGSRGAKAMTRRRCCASGRPAPDACCGTPTDTVRLAC